jgi:hypothetical protein
MKDGATLGGELALPSVGNKLKPILAKRAAQVAKTIADFNQAEDEFIAKKLGASSLSAPEGRVDVAGIFAEL